MTEEETTVQPKSADKLKDDRRRSALVKSSSGLAPYGTPEELAEMVGRMRYMIPGGNEMKDEELWGLSQSAFVLKLNPFAKEICWLKDGPFPQIRGVRRLGREQLQELYGPTGRPNLDFIQLADPVERDKNLIPDGALAYKCVGMIPAKRTVHTEDAQRFALALFGDGPRPQNGHEIVLEAIGPMPVTVGIGYITKEEMEKKDKPRWFHICSDKELNTEKMYGTMKRVLRGHDPCPTCGYQSRKGVNRYPHVQCAMKRAEAHFWYQECDLPFELGSGGEGLADFGLDDDTNGDDHVSLDEVVEGQYRTFGDDERPTYRGQFIPEGLLADTEAFVDWKNQIDDLAERKVGVFRETEVNKEEERKPRGGDLYRPRPATATTTTTTTAPPATEQGTLPLNGRTSDEVKAEVIAWTESKEFLGRRKNEALVQQAAVMLNACFSGQATKVQKTNRQRVTLFLFGKPSLKDLTGAQLLATLKLIDAQESRGGQGKEKKWVPNAIRTQEIRRIAKEVAEG